MAIRKDDCALARLNLSSGGEKMGRDVHPDEIDFSAERRRLREFFGRQDLLAEIDRKLQAAPGQCGWVLIRGSPGMGKSALLSRWLGPFDEPATWPHHFIRNCVEGWDQPLRITASLAFQVEARYPDFRDPAAHPERRLAELLRRISRERLKPSGDQLILVIDGLDETQATGSGNPLASFLPVPLPAGVFILCASRPDYPYLGLLEKQDNVYIGDLDAERWNRSNAETVELFWSHHGAALGLPRSFCLQAYQAARGNLLYCVMLLREILATEEHRRGAIPIPQGLQHFLEDLWNRRLDGLPALQTQALLAGIGVVAAAREALPLSVIEEICDWRDTTLRSTFLRVFRPLLLEQPAAWAGEPAYRPFHESFREFIVRSRGPAAMRSYHQCLAAHLATWPLPDNASAFQQRYATSHALLQWIEAGNSQQVDRLCRDFTYWQARVSTSGTGAIEADMQVAVSRCAAPPSRKAIWVHLLRAVRDELHWWRNDLAALPEVIYNRLRCLGWSQRQLRQELRLPFSSPRMVLLRHPLSRLDQACLLTLTGHRGCVTSCVFTSDGQRLLSTSEEGEAKVWDRGTGRELRSLEGHTASINSSAAAPDGARLATAADNDVLLIWYENTGIEIRSMGRKGNGPVVCAWIGSSHLISGGSDAQIDLWDVERGQIVHSFIGHEGPVLSLAVTPDGRRLVSASEDRTIRLWDIEQRRLLATMIGHEERVTSCALTPDGRRLVSASWDRTLRIWDLHSHRCLYTFVGHEDAVTTCAISPDGRVLVSGSFDCTLRVWELRDRALLRTLVGHSAPVTACAIARDGAALVSASADQTLRLWDMTAARTRARYVGHERSVSGVALSTTGARGVSVSEDGTIRLWDVGRGEECSVLTASSGKLTACSLAGDDRHLAVAAADHAVHLWDLSSGIEVRKFAGHSSDVFSCALAADGRRLLSGSLDKTLKLWDVQGGELLRTYTGHENGLVSCAISADGSVGVSGSSDETVRAWDLSGIGEPLTMKEHWGIVQSCALTPDGRMALSGSEDNQLVLWELQLGRVTVLPGHLHRVSACAISEDGRLGLSASWDRTIRMWDLETGACLATLRGVSPFNAVALRGDTLIAGDTLGNVWLCEIRDQANAGSADASTVPLVYLCVDPLDYELSHEFLGHLRQLVLQQQVRVFAAQEVVAGTQLAAVKAKALEEAAVVVVLLSHSSVVSEEILSQVNFARATGKVVLPVLLRPCLLISPALSDLQIVPKQPVSLFAERDVAWVAVLEALLGQLAVQYHNSLDRPT